METEYRVLEDYPNYRIYKDGKVENTTSKKILKPRLQGRKNKQYYKVRLYESGKWKDFLNHRLLALLFLPNPCNYSDVDHINLNKLDNRLENLRWCSHSSNMRNYPIPITNKSGVRGVCYSKSHLGFVAFWNDEKGIKRIKRFSIKKYGDEAFNFAVKYRKEMEENYYK